MIFRHEYHGGVWIDVEQPDANEIREIAREFNIDERIETELLSPTPYPLVAGDHGTALLVLHYPAHSETESENRNQEIDFIVGHNFVITVRYEVVVPLDRLRKVLETETLVDGHASIHTDTLLEILFAHLYAAVRDHTNHISEHLTRAEKEMFSGHERQTVRDVSNVSREYLHLEAALAGQEEPLEHFLKELEQREYFGPSFAARAARILTERSQVARLITMQRAMATELRETNASLLEARQNEIMKALTTITVIVLPLELIAFVFGMHALGTPLEHNPNAFWIIMAGMVGTIGLMTAVFAKKHWIF